MKTAKSCSKSGAAAMLIGFLSLSSSLALAMGLSAPQPAIEERTPLQHETCQIRAVHAFDRQGYGFRDELEQVLLGKNYQIINSGALYDRYDVPVDELKVRDELLRPGSLLAVFYGDILGRPTSRCEDPSFSADRTYNCATRLMFFRVTELGELAQIADIDEASSRRTVDPERTARAMVRKAEAAIPRCELK